MEVVAGYLGSSRFRHSKGLKSVIDCSEICAVLKGELRTVHNNRSERTRATYIYLY